MFKVDEDNGETRRREWRSDGWAEGGEVKRWEGEEEAEVEVEEAEVCESDLDETWTSEVKPGENDKMMMKYSLCSVPTLSSDI